MLRDAQATKQALVKWIQEYFAKNGPTCSAVVGISGGEGLLSSSGPLCRGPR